MITAVTASGIAGGSHTASARAGADVLCKTLSVEWASSQVRINSVAPGPIWSETAEANYSATVQGKYGASVENFLCLRSIRIKGSLEFGKNLVLRILDGSGIRCLPNFPPMLELMKRTRKYICL